MSASNLPQSGGFLLTPIGQGDFQTPEDFSEDALLIKQSADDFFKRRVWPSKEAIEDSSNYEIKRQLLKEAGDLGLLGIDAPEEYGGSEAGKTISMLVSEALSSVGSFGVTFSAQTGIGMLPLVYFGTDEQQDRYLEKLVSGDWVAAYCLSEPGSGSDALSAKTKAILSDDGKFYVLNGTKAWISNAGFADLFVVFAQIDGDKFSAFLIEKDAPGLRLGPEEKKMGMSGSSTRQVILEDCQVPVENLLGDIGKGHRIALNVLNVGRFKVGAQAAGACQRLLEVSYGYASERKQFKQPLWNFGMIKEKLVGMQLRIYALRSMVYRVAGMRDECTAVAGESDQKAKLKVIQRYSMEDCILKVFGSEALDYCADEGVQIHGGYGFSREYEVEGAYRDSRVIRIFEGTNEINRLQTPAMLLKQVMKGAIPMATIMQIANEFGGKDAEPSAPENLSQAIENAKKALVWALSEGANAYGPALTQHQLVLSRIADCVIDIFAADSALARATKASEAGAANAELQQDLADAIACWKLPELRRNLEQVASYLVSKDGEKLTRVQNNIRSAITDPAPQDLQRIKRIATAMEESVGSWAG